MAFEDTLRATRDAKLQQSDVDMLRAIEGAASFSAFVTARAEWITYRQALRDLPASFPEEMDESNIPAMPLSPTEQATLDAATE
jgi:hypothetical protein